MFPPRSVFITGTRTGLGLEMVRQFSLSQSPPDHLFASCRRMEEAEELKELSRQHPFIHLTDLDVTDYASYESVVKQVDKLTQGKGLNLLINNAGISGSHSFDDVTAEVMIDVYKVATVAPLMMTKAFLPLLSKARSLAGVGAELSCSKAAVLTMSSFLGSFGMLADYGEHSFYPVRATKAGLNLMMHRLADDLRPQGILCALIEPGWARTKLGGHQATITAEHSIRGLLKTISEMSGEHNGKMVDYRGIVLPF